MPGYRLDRYELLAPVAEGGMGEVWLARQKGKHGFEKLVAIKTLLRKLASDDHFRQMFLDESRIASRIEHENVAKILDLGEESDVLYLVMEWVDGDALSRIERIVTKKEETLPVAICAKLIADICGGLHVAHELRGPDGVELGVVHRDVSPQNILVTTGGVAKLIDFGIAKARDRASGDTSEGLLKGKIEYMAPEQALGQRVDRRADVWGAGDHPLPSVRRQAGVQSREPAGDVEPPHVGASAGTPSRSHSASDRRGREEGPRVQGRRSLCDRARHAARAQSGDGGGEARGGASRHRGVPRRAHRRAGGKAP